MQANSFNGDLSEIGTSSKQREPIHLWNAGICFDRSGRQDERSRSSSKTWFNNRLRRRVVSACGAGYAVVIGMHYVRAITLPSTIS